MSFKVKTSQYAVNIGIVQKLLQLFIRPVERLNRKVRFNVVLLSCCIMVCTKPRNGKTPRQPRTAQNNLKRGDHGFECLMENLTTQLTQSIKRYQTAYTETRKTKTQVRKIPKQAQFTRDIVPLNITCNMQIYRNIVSWQLAFPRIQNQMI